MNKNQYTTKGARVIFNGRPGVVMKALEYKTVINFDDAERWVHLRHNQNDMSLLKSFEDVSKKSSYDEIKPKLINFLKSRKGNATARATVTNSFEDLRQIRQELKNIGFKKIEYSIVSAKFDAAYSLEEKNRKKILKDLEVQADEILDSIHNKQNINSTKIIDNIKNLRSRAKSDFYCGAGWMEDQW